MAPERHAGRTCERVPAICAHSQSEIENYWQFKIPVYSSPVHTASRLLVILCLLALPAAAQKTKRGIYLSRRPDLIAEVKVKLVHARQPCENYAWAAALQTLLAAQDVDLPQDYWIDKADGGQCRDHAISLEETARLLDGEYTLPTADGARKARLTTEVTLGTPQNDPLLAALIQGRPALLLWKQRAYVLYGALYDEFTYPNGQRLFDIRELRLLDPQAPHGQSDTATFDTRSDDPADLGGILLISVTFCPTNVIVCR